AAVAAIAIILAGRTPYAPAPATKSEPERSPRDAWPVYSAIAISGAAALGAEVVWTRLLSLLLGGTVYTFSFIAAAFLAGLGIGSSVAASLARTSRRPGLLLAICQFGVALGAAWTAWLLSRAFPYWPIDPTLAPGPWYNFQIDLVRTALAVLPPACFW